MSHTDESYKDETRVCGYILQNELKYERKKSQEPFQSYLLTGQADTAKKAGIDKVFYP